MLLRASTQWWTVPVCTLAAAAMLMAGPNDSNGTSDDVESMASLNHAAEDMRREYARRQEIKSAIVLQLTNGELTLHEATGQFLQLNLEIPEIMNSVRSSYIGASDEEKTAVNVVEYVRLSAHSDEVRAGTVKRLRDEFAARYGHPPIGR